MAVDTDVLAKAIGIKTGAPAHIARVAAQIATASKQAGAPMSAADLSATIANLRNTETQNKQLFLNFVRGLSSVEQANVAKRVAKLTAAMGIKLAPVIVQHETVVRKMSKPAGVSGFGSFGDFNWGALADGFAKTMTGIAPAVSNIILGKYALDKVANVPPATATPDQQAAIAKGKPDAKYQPSSGFLSGVSPWLIGGVIFVIGGLVFFMTRRKHIVAA